MTTDIPRGNGRTALRALIEPWTETAAEIAEAFDLPDWALEEPAPLIRVARYPGDAVEDLLAHPVKGPNVFGEPLLALHAIYDREARQTRVWFRHATERDIEAVYARAAAELAGRVDHPAFFAGAARAGVAA